MPQYYSTTALVAFSTIMKESSATYKDFEAQLVEQRLNSSWKVRKTFAGKGFWRMECQRTEIYPLGVVGVTNDCYMCRTLRTVELTRDRYKKVVELEVTATPVVSSNTLDHK
ncbi:1511_t:CDS:2, partial [Funneliformis mosseae]